MKATSFSIYPLAVLLFLLIANHVTLADPTADGTAESTSSLLASTQKTLGDGIRFRVGWTADNYYRVYMQPDTTPQPNLTLNSQLTLRVPHATGTDQFAINSLNSTTADTEWNFDSRSNTPSEAPEFDYLSFSLTINSAGAFNWQAGEEMEVFNFKNSGACLGSVTVLDNETDPFIIPVNNGGNNSAVSNPGNQINNLGWNSDDIQANNYLGNYGPAAVCIPPEPIDNGTGDGAGNGSGNGSDNSSGSDTDSTSSGSGTGDNTSSGNGSNGTTGINLQVRGILQGAYNGLTGLMRDDLNNKDLIPTIQPFADAETSFDYKGLETLSATVSGMSDGDAPVDWVLVELLDVNDRETRLASKAAILQRDGDVVDAQTGSAALNFPAVAAGDYYVGLNHRNHLGVVTLDALTLSIDTRLADFSSPALPVYGDHSRYSDNGISMLWGGEADNNNSLISTGPGNDISTLLVRVLSGNGNNTFNSNFRLNGYNKADFNLDGMTLFAGPDNDSNITMSNVLLHPENKELAANFIVKGQKPRKSYWDDNTDYR